MKQPRQLADRVRELLVAVPGVTEKRMFGSLGFLVAGHLCVSARPERIMCRIDPEMHDEAIREHGCATVIMRGKEYRGYVYVQAEAVQTQASLKRWMGLALAYNQCLVEGSRALEASRAGPRP